MRTAFIVAVLAAWSLLVSVWGPTQSDAGLGMDPDGKPGPYTTQTDEGLGMDPDGKPGS